MGSIARRDVFAGGSERAARAVLIALDALMAVSALFGGGALIARPDGSLLQLPASYLEASPFADYLIPGLALFWVIGVGHLAALIGLLARVRVASLASAVFGAGVVVYVYVEVLFARSLYWLQPTCLLIGLVTAALGYWLWRRTEGST